MSRVRAQVARVARPALCVVLLGKSNVQAARHAECCSASTSLVEIDELAIYLALLATV